jgi:ketosteroid isomerase-like protein
VQPGPPPLSTVTPLTVTTGLAPTAEGAVPPGVEALAVVEAFRQAYERQELHTLMGLLGAEPWEQTVRGRPAVEALYARNFGTLHTIRCELSQLEVAGLDAEDAVIVHGQYRIRARQGSWLLGRSLDVTGPIRWTLRREDGALRIAGIDYELRRQ